MEELPMPQTKLNNESGFTLSELVTVVAIIGILAAIAIPQFSGYRKRGFEATLRSDLRNAAVAQEAYFAQHLDYRSGPLSGAIAGYNKSPEILGMTAVKDANTFTLTATHANCSGIVWSYDSTTATISGASCS
jgi:type IV pilus assembly protein PilA